MWLSVVGHELLYFMYQYHRRHRRSEFLKPMSIENRRHRRSEFLKPMSIENLILAFFLNSCQVDILKLFVCGSTYLFNLNESIPISKTRNTSNRFFFVWSALFYLQVGLSPSCMWIGLALRSWLDYVDLYKLTHRQLCVFDTYTNFVCSTHGHICLVNIYVSFNWYLN